MKPHLGMDADGKPVHPFKADALKKVVDEFKVEDRPFNNQLP